MAVRTPNFEAQREAQKNKRSRIFEATPRPRAARKTIAVIKTQSMDTSCRLPCI
jgi:hypothetical protein